MNSIKLKWKDIDTKSDKIENNWKNLSFSNNTKSSIPTIAKM